METLNPIIEIIFPDTQSIKDQLERADKVESPLEKLKILTNYND